MRLFIAPVPFATVVRITAQVSRLLVLLLALLPAGRATLAGPALDLDVDLNLEDLVPLSLAKPAPAARQLIRDFEAGRTQAALSLIALLGPGARPVYLVISPCCDHFNYLYDSEGRSICAPTGGYGGAGDGLCPLWVYDAGFWRRIKLPSGTKPQQPWPPAPPG